MAISTGKKHNYFMSCTSYTCFGLPAMNFRCRLFSVTRSIRTLSVTWTHFSIIFISFGIAHPDKVIHVFADIAKDFQFSAATRLNRNLLLLSYIGCISNSDACLLDFSQIMDTSAHIFQGSSYVTCFWKVMQQSFLTPIYYYGPILNIFVCNTHTSSTTLVAIKYTE